MRRAARFVLCLAPILIGSCTAVVRTPPLDARPTPAGPRPGVILLTSGAFGERQRARVIGFLQMTEEGYRWFHELELRSELEPRSLLNRIGAYAGSLGAQGVQHLVIVDGNPQTGGERVARQVNTAVRVLDQLRRAVAPTALADGTRTRYEVFGELVRFQP